jgi:integrase
MEKQRKVRQRVRLTRQIAEKTDAPQAGHIMIWDSEVIGFGVRITANGARSYVLRYVPKGHTRERLVTVCKVCDMPVAEARERAAAMRGKVVDGADPLKDREALRKAETMKEFGKRYLIEHAKEKKRPRSVKEDKRYLEKYIYPVIGDKKVIHVTHSDITYIHRKYGKTPYQANRIVSLLSKMFSIAVKEETRPDNPARGVEKYHEDKVARVLTIQELQRLADALNNYENKRAADAVRLIMLTGSRKAEAFTAQWSKIDLNEGIWTKPSAHTKQKREEHVPLSAMAVDFLKVMKADGMPGVDWVFPGNIEGKPITDVKKAWATILKRAKIDGAVRIHDLRHTYASRLVSSGETLVIVGKLLGHTQAQTTARYAKADAQPARKASDSFADMLKG